MNIAIIEDEALAARRLKDILMEIDPAFKVMAILDSVRKSIAWLNDHPAPDLLLMDIELGDGKSFDIFEKASVSCPVIFITAYDEYAIRAFKVNSIDYLLKPVKQQELQRSIEKLKQVKKLYSQKQQEGLIQSLLLELQKQNTLRERFLIKQGDRLIPVEVSEVAYFFTRKKNNFIKTFDNREYIIDQTLDEIEISLDAKKFIRANRQFIVTLNAIVKVHLWFGSKLKLDLKPDSEEDVIVSREKATAFRQWLGEQ
ncbi:MAG: response regulator transcription factor [Chitinophagaceae bacterium]|nr:response regulator transcription factor [Chitinophagaceae bacterium]